MLLPLLLSTSQCSSPRTTCDCATSVRGGFERSSSMVLDANPDLHIFSVGHAYAPVRSNRRQRRRANRQRQRENNHIHAPPTSYPLLESVSRGKGLHGTTLLALRHPEGTRSLLDCMVCMETVPRGKRCHLDRFLFRSKLHNIGVALSDPPLVGWGEVSGTLSTVGSGCRKNRGDNSLPQFSVVKYIGCAEIHPRL